MLQRLIRPIATTLLLFVSLFLSVAPLVEAAEIGNGKCSHSCCRRNATHCGPQSHKQSGPSLAAGQNCGKACLSIGLPSRIAPGVLKGVAPAALVGQVLMPVNNTGLPHTAFLYFPSLHQRPPPAH